MGVKWIGLSLLFAVCGFCGAWMTYRLTVRTRELESLLQMLAYFRTQMQFSRAPLQTLLTNASRQSCAPAFLSGVMRCVSDGQVFPLAWKRAVEQQPNTFYCEEDRRLLLSLGELLGSTDAHGQEEGLLLHEQLAKQSLEKARRQQEKHGKTYLTLGVLTGLTLVILLV
ncbi:MAG: stage III sporulation protein AB [Oscillospiraceae bacterium]|jgi:stage III sporulation protein AB|nr:stage III sporulation protein AB [Oscillospiraceae bacterium]